MSLGPLPTEASAPRDVRLAVHQESPNRAFLSAGPVPAGKYEIRVQQEGTQGARYAVVALDAGEAKSLAPPLRLERAGASLRVTVEPPVSPSGEPWRLHLLFGDPAQGTVEEVLQQELSGALTLSSLVEGLYRARLLEPSGRLRAEEVVDLGSKPETVTFVLGKLAIAGTVSLGEEPLADAKLVFRRAGVVAQFLTDSQGRFAGDVASEGDWEVRVIGQSPAVDRRVKARVERGPDGATREIVIALPDRGLAGKVVRESGEGAGAAMVLYRSRSRPDPILGSVRADEDGHFRVAGLDPGGYVLMAQRDEEASDDLDVEVDEKRGGPDDLVLRLRKMAKIRGVVTSIAGPIARARLEFRSAKSPVLGLVDEVTADVDGRFEYTAAVGLLPLLVTTSGPGFATTIRFVSAADDPLEILLPTDYGEVVLEDSAPSTPDGTARTFLVMRDGLPLLEGPTAAFRRVVEGDGLMKARTRLAPGPFIACSGTFAELHEMVVLGRRLPDVKCSTGTASTGLMSAVALGPERLPAP